MKKKIILALSAVLCASGVFAIEGDSPKIVSEQSGKENFSLGKDQIAQIRQKYQEGQYDAFLKGMSASYEEVLEGGRLADLISLRKGEAIDLQWLQGVKLLQKERNEALLQTVAGEDSLFAQKVRSIASATDEVSLFWKIHQKAPGAGENSDENALISLDLEYEYKAIHLGAIDHSQDQYYALKMEQMDKLCLAAQSFEGVALKDAIGVLAQNLDTRLAQNFDQQDLRLLARGDIKPVGKTQEQVVSILQAHQEKVGQLPNIL